MTPFSPHPIHSRTEFDVVILIELAFFLYFLFTNAFYILTVLIALFTLPRFVKLHRADPIHYVYSAFELPVSVIIPAYNESESIIDTVNSLLEQKYSQHEVIVVNDGSIDRTLDILREHWSLELFPEAYRVQLATKEIRGIYQSRTHAHLRVIDKANGGKADALNAGINAARYPIVFACDGDSYYTPDALACLVEPMVKDPRTVVSGGAIGVSNECIFKEGQIVRRRLSKSWIVRFQVLEYMRAFLSSRLGWAPLNALCIVSGACGLFRKSVLVDAGGYRTDTVWEDMEMTMRVHHLMRSRRTPYRIAFTPFIVCWTRVPDTLSALWQQRISWHRHVGECMAIHRGMLMGRFGTVGWLAFPYFVLAEWISPIMALSGLIFGFIAAYFGFLSYYSQVVLLGLVFALALAVCIAAIVLDELSFNTYSAGDLLILLLASALEFFGFRQFCMIANFVGGWAWFAGWPIRGHSSIPGWRFPPYKPS